MDFSVKHNIGSFNDDGKFDNAKSYVYRDNCEDNRYKF